MAWPQLRTARRRRDPARIITALLKLAGLLIGAVLFFAGCWLVSGWFFMLAVGVVHRDWWPAVPLIGYRGALPVAFMLGLAGVISTAGVAAASRSK